METIYIKKFIKTQADLPKEGIFICHNKNNNTVVIDTIPKDIDFWMSQFDWYLLPVELPTEEEIEKKFPTDLKILCDIHNIPIRFNSDEGHYLDQLRGTNVDRQTGVNWLLNRLKSD